MTTPTARAATVTALAMAAVLAFADAGQAQTNGSRSGGLLDDLFGGNASRNKSGQVAQVSDADLTVRIDRLENQIRQLTGAIEQLQFRNQQLEQALRNMQGGNADVSGQPDGRPASGAPRTVTQQPMRPPPAAASVPAAPPPQSGRRSDVFDPTLHPNAPGTPRALGGGPAIVTTEPGARVNNTPPVGVAGGREAGAPLDLATLAQPTVPNGAALPPSTSVDPTGTGALPPPPPRNTSATGVHAAVQPPSQTPQDQYDLAYGYMLHKDYALAEDAFRTFLKKYPQDRRVADATYWLGESMFQRQRYRDAAESFLAVTTKHEKSIKAPDALFRLGQALAALGENEAACAALSEVSRKYPRASAGVKQGVQREQRRVRC